MADPTLAAECSAFAAQHLAATDLAAAQDRCATIPPGLWHDECGFLVCDAANVSVVAARRCCADAGRYSTRCLGHAVTREVTAAVAAFPRGAEDQAWQAAKNASIRALGPAGEDRAEAVMVRILADRATGFTLTKAVCGTSPQQICSATYAELVTRAAAAQDKDQQALVRPACAKKVSLQRATSLGLPPWDESLNEAAQTAFSRMCRR